MNMSANTRHSSTNRITIDVDTVAPEDLTLGDKLICLAPNALLYGDLMQASYKYPVFPFSPTFKSTSVINHFSRYLIQIEAVSRFTHEGVQFGGCMYEVYDDCTAVMPLIVKYTDALWNLLVALDAEKRNGKPIRLIEDEMVRAVMLARGWKLADVSRYKQQTEEGGIIGT